MPFSVKIFYLQYLGRPNSCSHLIYSMIVINISSCIFLAKIIPLCVWNERKFRIISEGYKGFKVGKKLLPFFWFFLLYNTIVIFNVFFFLKCLNCLKKYWFKVQFSRRVPKKTSLKKQLNKKYKQMVKATIQKLKGDVEKIWEKKFEKTIIMH